MDLNFCQDQIAAWATLSGDYNPIHFDETYARQAGLKGIVVHGMLPLMYIKCQIADAIELQAGDDWLTVKAVFRQPVERFLTYALEIKARNERSRFSLRVREGGDQAITGTIYRTTPGINAVSPIEGFVIDADRFRMKKTVFTELYPSFDKAWLLIDAIAFSELLNNEIPFTSVKSLLRFDEIASQNDLMKKTKTLQTSHLIDIEPSFCNMGIENLDEQCEIRCDVLTPITLSGESNSLIGLYPFNISINGKFVMRSEVGLQINFNYQLSSLES